MSRPVIEFPDATSVMRDYLASVLDGVPVVSRVPDERPTTFVRVKRLGGLRNSLITDRPRLDVQFWAESEEAAHDLMQRGRAHILAMAGAHGDTTVYRVREESGAQWLPDHVSGHPRYAIAFGLSLRGRRLE
ncbi:hypothetical protein [Streptomyces sp. SM12]|uniref:hypothetical protein n=1 Tax=Streptomyces sp. SM12 TaxID=1071602 RepID=UPI000CD4EE9C|nr:hypothetical protein [Streptomyces sp. SM12]